MSAFETLMWRAEERGMHSPVIALQILDTVPDWGRLVAVHEWATRMVPRARQRVVEAPLGLGAPRWSPDPHFELRSHLSRVRLCEGGGFTALLEAAARVAMSPFDRTRSPWQAVLYEGLPDGRAGYLLKMHHAGTDGLGVGQLLAQLHSARREPRADKPQPPTPAAAQISGLGVLAHQVGRDIASLPGLLAGAAGAARGVLTHPVGAVGTAFRYASSLRRVLSPPAAPGSPLLARRGPNWRFAALDIPLPGLRAAAKAAGATLNDAYLGALLGGYRRYHEALGAPVAAIPMAIPLSLRRPGDPGGGNRIAGARFSGPVHISDPTARIQTIRELILSAKREPAIDTIGLLSPALARLPGAISAPLAGSQTKGNDLQATLLPGVRREMYLAGAHIERVYPYAPLPGCAAMVILVTHGTVGCVGVNFDAAAVTDPELFLRCLSEGFTEVLSLHPDAAPPRIRT